ncbi:MAG: hypothetical protein KJZ85_09145 [Rhodobacteraceae bacterium]|jgi:hypothetical protein|nr:hypothetical protein [Paracoccaceae bacterium]
MTGQPVGWLNTALPLAGLAALAVAALHALTPRATRSQSRLAAAAAGAAAVTLIAGAVLFGILRGLRPAGLADAPSATAFALLRASAGAALVWGPLLALGWLMRAQGVERRRGEAIAREGRG